MNSQRIKDKLKALAKDKSTNFNILLRVYMYETFIKRLSVSSYRLNFVLKGGYYLSTLLGIENRATMDIDASLKNFELSHENIQKIVSEIISIDIDDGAIFTIDDVSFIRDEDEYGGYRITLTVKIDNMKETFHFDVATGDPITPREIVYKYKSIIDNDYINVLAYNLETILAEKLETIFVRGERNSRMKDYYDIYLIMTLKFNQVSIKHLKTAIRKTFENRNFVGDIKRIFDDLKESYILETRWKSYTKRKGINDISYFDTINCVKELIDIIEVNSLEVF